MLIITIPEGEAYNEKLSKFIKVPSVTLKLEHSLLSLYKWESKHHKYFIDNKDLTVDEILDYIKCMTINSDVDDSAYDYLTEENLDEIRRYMEDKMTATWFREDDTIKPRKKEIITAEVIYSSMISLNIPIEIFEKRHINHVLTLIRVCGEMQNPDKDKKKKKTNQRELAQHYSELNKARKAKLGTKG